MLAAREPLVALSFLGTGKSHRYHGSGGLNTDKPGGALERQHGLPICWSPSGEITTFHPVSIIHPRCSKLARMAVSRDIANAFATTAAVVH